MRDAQPAEPHRALSAALAAGVHVAFLLVLVFGVTWKNREAAPVTADLWGDLPASSARPAPEPKAEPAPEPEPPKPAPEPEAKPAPKPDIALKAKEEEKRKQAARQAEKKTQDEKKRQDAAKAQHDAAAAKNAPPGQGAPGAKAMGDAVDRIKAKIRSKVVQPPNLVGNPQAEFDVTLMPTGQVLNVQLTRSSGLPAYDSAVERAIYKADPLPMPDDPQLVAQFRHLHLKFRPNE